MFFLNGHPTADQWSYDAPPSIDEARSVIRQLRRNKNLGEYGSPAQIHKWLQCLAGKAWPWSSNANYSKILVETNATMVRFNCWHFLNFSPS